MKKLKISYKLDYNLKSQGLSFNVIIIAAIALIILVVLIAVFTGRFGLFSSGLKEAANCDKGCKALGYKKGSVSRDTPCSSATDPLPGYTGEDKYCCCYNSLPSQ